MKLLDEGIAEIVAEWMRFAKVDLDTAKFLDEMMYPKPLEIICYHCQQSAEKALKAFLIANELDPPKIHDLRILCEMCADFEQKFSEMAKQCDWLTRYGVAPKYPYGVNIAENDVKTAIENAQSVYDRVNLFLM